MIWNPGFEKFTLFWRTESVFSQWHPSEFLVDSFKYNCAEQYMMAQKAKLFGDKNIYRQIILSDNPKTQKELGRKVENFDPVIWSKIAKIYVYQANMAKFLQNPSLLLELVDTYGTLLVEASPYDRVWGIGLSAAEAEKEAWQYWPGQNLLGEVLTKVRQKLMEV